jgi:NedA-like, galactose-binding domain
MSRGKQALVATFVVAAAWPATAQVIRVEVGPDADAPAFVPNQALGAGIDRLGAVSAEKMFTKPAIDRVLSAGWQTVSYRQNTELYVEAWHWNPAGTWSDPAGRGYFTGSTSLGEPIAHSYGYPLPHRGVTRNDGVDRGYSRLTDGDPDSYWKSNPYLTRDFTGEDDAKHPQWVTIDLAGSHAVNALRIAWAEPFARRYLVQHWTGEDPIKRPTQGVWVTFPGGVVNEGQGGTVTLALSAAPMPVRFLRLWMTASSNTCDSHGAGDRRNCVGYAIRELSLGTQAADGTFYDLVRHTPDPDQTATISSSIDPWHEASGMGPKTREQVGLDKFYTSGYTRGLPAMIPVSLIYATPEDAAAQLAYLKKRGYPISWVEMGEEPDGQYMLPEDYGALYLQFATALHRVDPGLKLGGPVFEGVNEDILVWPDAEGRSSWLGRFVDYLKAHDRLADLAFMSFEHYPYEPCKIQWSHLYDEPALIGNIMKTWRADGLPADLPLLITEVNVAWAGGESFVDTFGALWLADFVGAFFAEGGDGVYYFHYIPGPLHGGCNDSYATFGLFNMDENYQFRQPTSQFHASQLITQEWVQPGDGEHRVFRAASDVMDPASHALVTAYAVRRPDHQWSLMVVNKDQWNAHPVRIVFHDAKTGKERTFAGPVETRTFGAAQYQWHANDAAGFADPDLPPVRGTVTAGDGTLFELPRASITVLRGRLPD